MSQQLLLEVHPEIDAGPNRAARLTGLLEQELRFLPLERIERPDGGRPPGGAKGTALQWAQLAVTFSGGLPMLVQLIRGWLQRNPECSVTIEADGDKLTISGESVDAQRQVVDRWLAQHGA